MWEILLTIVVVFMFAGVKIIYGKNWGEGIISNIVYTIIAVIIGYFSPGAAIIFLIIVMIIMRVIFVELSEGGGEGDVGNHSHNHTCGCNRS